MNQLIQKKTLLGMLVAALMCVALLAVAAPQEAYAQQGWNSNSKGYWYEYDNQGHYYKNGWHKFMVNAGADDAPHMVAQWAYFNKNGYAKTGWIKSGKSWYYLNTDGVPYMLTMQFLKLNGKMYYLDSSGKMASGWCKTHLPVIGSYLWVYANKNGELQQGWKKISGKWYLLGWPESYSTESVTRYTAVAEWVTLNGSTYYLGNWDSCAMVTGWQKIDGKWYYFAKSGAMQKNKWIGNYYVQDDGTMATNTWIGKYHVNASGKWDKTK